MDTNCCYCLYEHHNYHRESIYLPNYITTRRLHVQAVNLEQDTRNSIELWGFLLLVDFMGHIAGGRQYTVALFRVLLGVCTVAVGTIIVHVLIGQRIQVLHCDAFD